MRASIGVDAFLALLVAHSACCFAGITIVVMTAAFVVLTDMEQPFSGFVQIDTTMFLLIRRDIRVVLRSAHMEQLAAIEKESKESSGKQLTHSQLEVRDLVGPSYMSLRSYTAAHSGLNKQYRFLYCL